MSAPTQFSRGQAFGKLNCGGCYNVLIPFRNETLTPQVAEDGLQLLVSLEIASIEENPSPKILPPSRGSLHPMTY